jgi:hypothetical protein
VRAQICAKNRSDTVMSNVDKARGQLEAMRARLIAEEQRRADEARRETEPPVVIRLASGIRIVKRGGSDGG